MITRSMKRARCRGLPGGVVSKKKRQRQEAWQACIKAKQDRATAEEAKIEKRRSQKTEQKREERSRIAGDPALHAAHKDSDRVRKQEARERVRWLSDLEGDMQEWRQHTNRCDQEEAHREAVEAAEDGDMTYEEAYRNIRAAQLAKDHEEYSSEGTWSYWFRTGEAVWHSKEAKGMWLKQQEKLQQAASKERRNSEEERLKIIEAIKLELHCKERFEAIGLPHVMSHPFFNYRPENHEAKGGCWEEEVRAAYQKEIESLEHKKAATKKDVWEAYAGAQHAQYCDSSKRAVHHTCPRCPWKHGSYQEQLLWNRLIYSELKSVARQLGHQCEHMDCTCCHARAAEKKTLVAKQLILGNSFDSGQRASD